MQIKRNHFNYWDNERQSKSKAGGAPNWFNELKADPAFAGTVFIEDRIPDFIFEWQRQIRGARR